MANTSGEKNSFFTGAVPERISPTLDQISTFIPIPGGTQNIYKRGTCSVRVRAIIGGLFSFIGGYIALDMMIGNTDYYFSPQCLIYVLYGIIIGLGVYLLSGVILSRKAVKINPIEAL